MKFYYCFLDLVKGDKSRIKELKTNCEKFKTKYKVKLLSQFAYL